MGNVTQSGRTPVACREEGLGGVYRGLGTVLTIGTPAFILYIVTYELAKRVLVAAPVFGGLEPLAVFLAGIVAEAVACLLYIPVDVIKERLQVGYIVQSMLVGWDKGLWLRGGCDPAPKVQRPVGAGEEGGAGRLPQYRDTWDAARTILREEGLGAMYRGYGASLWSFGPFSAFYFVFYEQFKQWAAVATGTASIGELPFALIVLRWVGGAINVVGMRIIRRSRAVL
jgi:hypothetical protein